METVPSFTLYLSSSKTCEAFKTLSSTAQLAHLEEQRATIVIQSSQSIAYLSRDSRAASLNIIRRPRCPRGSAPKKPCFGCFGPRPCGQRRRHSIPVLYGGEFWQGLSCCGVSLFRMPAERCSSRPLRATVEHVR